MSGQVSCIHPYVATSQRIFSLKASAYRDTPDSLSNPRLKDGTFLQCVPTEMNDRHIGKMHQSQIDKIQQSPEILL
jgi:hypothetical protein